MTRVENSDEPGVNTAIVQTSKSGKLTPEWADRVPMGDDN